MWESDDEIENLFDKNPNDPRYHQLVADKELYGDEKVGDYNGFRWRAKRFGGWCGYVFVGLEHQERCMELLATECTYDKDGWVGFDLNHCTDYPSSIYNFATFKTFPMCLQLIQDSINNIRQSFMS
jgi:hypothetical protein